MTDTNPIAISKASWRRFSNTIHWAWMEYIGWMRVFRVHRGEELLFLATEFGGEAGELMNNIKKLWRDGESEELRAKIRDEFADVHILLHHLQERVGGIDIEQACADKIEALFVRWPWIIKKPDLKMTPEDISASLEDHPLDIRKEKTT